jgi:hypothetical protein
MSRIIRCSKCLSTVYADASHCHSCGAAIQPAAGHRLIGRRGWFFVLLALGFFTIGDTIYWLNQRRNAFHRDTEGMQSARTFVEAFLRRDTEKVDDLLRSGKVLERSVAQEAARLGALLPVDEVEFVSAEPAGIVEEHPHYRREGRSLHREARRYYFRARVHKDHEIHVLRGQLCVEGLSGPRRILCFSMDAAEHHGPESSWTAELSSPEIEHFRARSEYPPNHEPWPVAGR